MPSLSRFVKFSRPLQLFDIPFLFDDINDVHALTEARIMALILKPQERKDIRAFSIRGENSTIKKFRIQNANAAKP